MLKVQEFLRASPIESLTEKFAIKVSRHPKYNNLVHFKYNQIDSPMGEEIVQEYRGLILDQDNDWKVVAYPFKKFFNYGEGHAAQIDWNTARVYDKLDGTMITMYHYDNTWHVATTGTPDGRGMAGNSHTSSDISWRDLFIQTLYNKGLRPPKETDHCFVFELTSPINRIVVDYKDDQVHLIGARDLKSLKEKDAEIIATWYEWKHAPCYRLQSVEEVIEAAKKLNGIQSEGFVVCDINFNRVKVKSPHYVALAHMKEKIGDRGIADVIKAGEEGEFLSYFPEFKPKFDELKGKYDHLVKCIDDDFQRIKPIQDRKEFAQAAQKTVCPSAMFCLLDGHFSCAKDFLAQHHTDKALKLLS